MQMERKVTEDADSIELLSIVRWLINGKWLLLTLTIFGAVGVYAYKTYTYVPMYTATASMVVNARPVTLNAQDGYIQVSNSDISLAKGLVLTYTGVMKSNRVMDYVRQDLQLDLPLNTIRSYIKLESVKDTQILNLTVTCPAPTLAMQIANSIMRVAPQAMMETVDGGCINVLDYATLPGRANSSDTVKTSVMAALVGMALGCGVVVAHNLLGFKISSARDVEAGLPIEVLEEVPHVKVPARQKKGLLISYKVRNNYLFVESYKRLSTVIQHTCGKSGMKKIMVTSSLPHEGKTTAAINLALGLMQNGNRVLLIDTDHQHPSVHTYLNVKKQQAYPKGAGAPGENPADGDIFMLPNGLEIMAYAHGKHRLHKTSDFYLQVQEMQDDYDFIIFDTPPTGILSDPLKLSRIVDGAVVIVRQYVCNRKDLEKTVRILEKVEIPILGCVINDMRSWSNRKYYYGKYKKYYRMKAS